MQKKWISKVILLSGMGLMMASPVKVFADVVSCPDCVAAIGVNTAAVNGTTSAVQGTTAAVNTAGQSIVAAVNRNTFSTKNQLQSDTDRLIAALARTGDSINDHVTDIYEQRKIFDAQKSPTICARQEGMARLALSESVASEIKRARGKFAAERSVSVERIAEDQMQRANASSMFFCPKWANEKGICVEVPEEMQSLDIDASRVLNPDDGVLSEEEALAARLFFQRVTNPFPAPPLPEGFDQNSPRAKTFRELLNVYASYISLGMQSLNNKISELEAPSPGVESSVSMELENAVNSLVAPANLQNNKQTSMMSGDISDMSQMTGLQTKIMWMMYKEMQRQGQVMGAMQAMMVDEVMKPRIDEARRSAAVQANN